MGRRIVAQGLFREMFATVDLWRGHFRHCRDPFVRARYSKFLRKTGVRGGSGFRFGSTRRTLRCATELETTTMKAHGKLQLTVWALGIGGAALFVAIIVRQDLSKVGEAFAAAGCAIVGVVAYPLVVTVFLDTVAW